MSDLGLHLRKSGPGFGEGRFRSATPLVIRPTLTRPAALVPDCTSDTALVLVGSFAGVEPDPFDDIAVNPDRDTLYGVVRNFDSSHDGLWRYSYPAIVNTEGAAVRWVARGAGEEWRGIAIDPSGNIYVGCITTAGPPHTETVYQITPSGTKTAWATRSRATNGALTGYQLAWSAVENCILAVGVGAGDSSGDIVKIEVSGFTTLESNVLTSGSPTCIAVTPDGALWFVGTISGSSHLVRRPSGGSSSNVAITNIASGAVVICGQPDGTFLFQNGVAYDGKIADASLTVVDDDRADATRVFAAHTSLDGQYGTFQGTGAGHNDDIYELHTCA